MLIKGTTETLIMAFTDVQRFVDSENEMEPFKQTEYYMNGGNHNSFLDLKNKVVQSHAKFRDRSPKAF